MPSDKALLDAVLEYYNPRVVAWSKARRARLAESAGPPKSYRRIVRCTELKPRKRRRN
jgi:hypothetical protein